MPIRSARTLGVVESNSHVILGRPRKKIYPIMPSTNAHTNAMER